jgi:hypothetical protein
MYVYIYIYVYIYMYIYTYIYRLQKIAQAKKDQANVFANKGGGMRKVAQKMRAVAAEMEEATGDVLSL